MDAANVLTLLSGGIDSSAVVASLSPTASVMTGLFVDYGQPSADSEWEAAQSIAHHYGILVQRQELGFKLIEHRGEYFARNALLTLVAAGITERRPLSIALGIHALSEYYDTTPLFLRHIQ